MKRILLGLLLVVVLAGCKSSPGQDFITVADGTFQISGKPYYFIGANYWYGAIIASPGKYGDRERLLRELDRLDSMGVNNLRVLVGAEGPDGEPFRVTPALMLSPGEYNDELLDGLDFLLAEMKKRGQYAILFLNNSWDWTGGYSQYLNWNGFGPIPYPNVPPNTWPQFMSFSGQFNSCDPCISMFEDHIRYTLGRTNRYTGLKYTEDPVIMTWEIANEPRAFSDANIPAMEAMIKRVAALLQELDKNHLVTTGTEGEWGCETRMEVFERVHADPNIDYLTMHIWPKNWSWLNIKDINGTIDSCIVKTNKYMDDHFEVAERLRKPLVLEEFGLPRDLHGYSPEESTVCRDKYYRNAFDRIVEHASRRGPLAGCNIWAYSGEGRPAKDHIYWQPGDDYLGDPPQEEQGLNSVYDTDSTVELIAAYNRRLNNPMKESGPADPSATVETVNLLAGMKAATEKGIMFGHQDDLAYGIGWVYPEGESDVRRVCSDYPAVYGMDLGDIEHLAPTNLDSVPFDKMKLFAREIWSRGGIITFSWHGDNPLTGGNAWDITSDKVVASVLPGGENHDKFKGWLDNIAAYFTSLTDEQGVAIPVVFRPYHEHTGSWFWWGQKLCTNEEYIDLWRFTVDYLCREKNVHNMLFAYSSSGDIADREQYLERYPGDDYIDLVGFDYYQMPDAGNQSFTDEVGRVLGIVAGVAEEHGKLAALTEAGYESIPDSTWWTSTLWPAVKDHNISYVLVWRNAHNRPGHFYAPYPGHLSAEDFIDFYNLPGTLFQNDLTKLDIYK